MAGFEVVEDGPSFTIEIVSVGKGAFGPPPPPPPPVTEVLVGPVVLGPVLGRCCRLCARCPPPLPEDVDVVDVTCMGVVAIPLSLSRFLPFFLDCAFFLLSRFCLMMSSAVQERKRNLVRFRATRKVKVIGRRIYQEAG